MSLPDVDWATTTQTQREVSESSWPPARWPVAVRLALPALTEMLLPESQQNCRSAFAWLTAWLTSPREQRQIVYVAA